MHGMAALVLPVLRSDGSAAVIKFQVCDSETEGEPAALRLWSGKGAVELIDYDEATGTMLLERLDSSRMLLSAINNSELSIHEDVVVIAQLLSQPTSVTAPTQLRRLGDIAGQMLDDLTPALSTVGSACDRELLRRCGAVLSEVVNGPGDRLLHWDLHFGNVLASPEGQWIAIDPKPLHGHWVA